MSTPLFVRSPSVGIWNEMIIGRDLSDWENDDNGSVDGSTIWTSLTGLVTEPTLIDEVLWSASLFNTDPGTLILAVAIDLQGIFATHRRAFASPNIEAGTSAKIASGRIPVGVTIPAGYQLLAAHDIQENGAGGYTNLGLVIVGGIAR